MSYALLELMMPNIIHLLVVSVALVEAEELRRASSNALKRRFRRWEMPTIMSARGVSTVVELMNKKTITIHRFVDLIVAFSGKINSLKCSDYTWRFWGKLCHLTVKKKFCRTFVMFRILLKQGGSHRTVKITIQWNLSIVNSHGIQQNVHYTDLCSPKRFTKVFIFTLPLQNIIHCTNRNTKTD